MLSLPPSVHVYFAAVAVDFRKGFDGLSGIVAAHFKLDPLCGHLFVFRNRRSDQIRVLFWDRTGYVLYSKRLAQGTFKLGLQIPEGATHLEIEAVELSLMLEGIDLSEGTRRKRWRAAKVAMPVTDPSASRSA